MATKRLNLSRDQLATFLKNHEQIKQFEALFSVADTIAPDVINEVKIEAGSAQATANEALAQISRLANESFEAASAQATANEAMAQLQRIANALELLATNPSQRNDNSTVTDYADFYRNSSYQAPHLEGRVFYDKSSYSLAYYNENQDVTVNIGREQLVRVYNNTGSTLLNGKMVYINGASSNWPTVTLAQADTKIASQSTLGMVTADIPNGQYGYVCTSGIVNGLNTSAYSPGTELYLSATSAGDWTSTAPLQPNYVVEVATVVTQDSTTGRLFVHVDKRDWFPNLDVLDASASITLPTTPTVFKATTVNSAQGVSYDTSTGVITVNESGSYALTLVLNALPSAANKEIYFHSEESPDGVTWTPVLYSGRQTTLTNSVETQVVIPTSRYFAVGTRLRFYLWADATVQLVTSDLPGTTPGTVKKPAYRFLMA